MNNELRVCNLCHELKPYTDFYVSKPKICKKCHRKKMVSYRSVPDTYAYFYAKMSRDKYYAKKHNIEFSLTANDYEDFKAEEFCYYCKMDCDIVYVTRKDNSLGFHKDNMAVCCDLCFRIHKWYHFNENEMQAIGKVVARYYRRTRNKKTATPPEELPFEFMEDKNKIAEILDVSSNI